MVLELKTLKEVRLNQNPMPMQKQEYYLAQISYLVAATMGGYKGDMTDFLLGEHEMKKQAKQAKADPKENPLFKNFNPIKKPKDK